MKRDFIRVVALLLATTITLGSCCSITKTEDVAVKNVIFMIGDGMGLAHVSMLLVEGDYAPTAFDSSHNIALAKTYPANNRITDSAAAGTALSTGYKTNVGMIGMTPDSVWVYSIADKAAKAGLSTGIAATCELQSATPAAFYGHAPSRKMADVFSEQLSHSSLDVAIGGGADFLDAVVEGVNHLSRLEQRGYSILYDMEELESCENDKIIGLFDDRSMPSLENGRPADYLTRATKVAINALSRNEKGFFLMVEGSQIDWEGHANNPAGILAEARDFEKAVKAAMEFADATPGTLVVITADHETGGMSIVNPEDGKVISQSGVAYDFATTNHSASLVPLYLYGAGAENINGIIENTDIPRSLASMLGLEW